MTPKTILLVEDDELDVISVQRTLKKFYTSYDLHVAHNGKEALTMLTRSEDPVRPDVVLLDTAAALSVAGRLTAYCPDDNQIVQVDRFGEIAGQT